LKRLILFICFGLFGSFVQAQQTFVTGKVTDATTGEALPFVNVYFTGTTVGATTDFDGFYTLQTSQLVDSVTASYVGYLPTTKAVKRGQKQEINLRLKDNTANLPEAIARPGVNPAHGIIKAAQANQDRNSYERLPAVQYESFTKVQLAVDQLSEKQRNRKMLKPILPLFDTVSQLNDGTNTPVLPIFISETISDFYIQRKPFKQKEVIKASRVRGVGLEDESATAQLLGSTFQQYNFHLDWIPILEKDFASPVGRAALDLYIFTLKDSVEIDGIKCYQIQVDPKRKGDLVFTGNMWIADSSFAIRRLQFYLDARANLNFLDQFKIQQEYAPTSADAWVPTKTRILINMDEPSSTAPGMIALFYVSNRNIVANEPMPSEFFETALEIQEDAFEKTEDYWEENRHEQQSEGDKKIAHMIDTLNNLPIVKTWVEWVNIIISGYKRVGKVDIGPYAFLYSFNALEGHRFRLGFRTNYLLTEHFVWSGYGAYGTYDKRWKYMAQMEWIPDKKDWTVIGIKHRDDVDQIGVTDQNYDQTNLFTSLALFQASQLNRTFEQKLWVKRQYSPSWSQRLTVHAKQYQFEPIGDRFNFAFIDFSSPGIDSSASDFRTSTVSLETRFSFHEQFLKNHNERYSLGPKLGPTVTLTITQGIQDFLKGQFDFTRVNLHIQQRVRMGRFGDGDYIFTAGKTFGTLPYPILDVQRGNQSLYANRSTYNLMNLFEFVSDEYIAWNYEQHFNGLLLNRVPLLKRLKWRFFVSVKGVWGGISDANLALLPPVDEDGKKVTQFNKLNKEPYSEFGYGIENIFAFGRVDFIHRVTHLDNPGISKFGVKLSVQFSF